MKDVIGGYPSEIEKSGSTITIRFFHGKKGVKVEHPDHIKFRLDLDSEDIKKLRKILS